MKVIFRTDASLQIGTGHVMRCLTLANALADKGARCEFICRAHDGNLIEFIRDKGYITHSLSVSLYSSRDESIQGDTTNLTPHSHWLGATQSHDADACASILDVQRPDWLIVDHYALDVCWEQQLASHSLKLMVIDDLADRPHACHLLLDQTFGRDAWDYRRLVPVDCQLLCGSQYALIRPEFVSLRHYSLQRRLKPSLDNLLITMGGCDKDNVTSKVLQALLNCPLPAECRITVVMGETSPWFHSVNTQSKDMPWPTRVLKGIDDMAQLMADSDLAIGAAGATSWERCCLGLPTIMFVLADNQIKIAQELEKAGAAKLVLGAAMLDDQLSVLLCELVSKPQLLVAMSKSSAAIVVGAGTRLVTALLDS